MHVLYPLVRYIFARCTNHLATELFPSLRLTASIVAEFGFHCTVCLVFVLSSTTHTWEHRVSRQSTTARPCKAIICVALSLSLSLFLSLSLSLFLFLFLSVSVSLCVHLYSGKLVSPLSYSFYSRAVLCYSVALTTVSCHCCCACMYAAQNSRSLRAQRTAPATRKCCVASQRTSYVSWYGFPCFSHVVHVFLLMLLLLLHAVCNCDDHSFLSLSLLLSVSR